MKTVHYDEIDSQPLTVPFTTNEEICATGPGLLDNWVRRRVSAHLQKEGDSTFITFCDGVLKAWLTHPDTELIGLDFEDGASLVRWVDTKMQPEDYDDLSVAVVKALYPHYFMSADPNEAAETGGTTERSSEPA